MHINTESIADLFMEIQWSSDIVKHTEVYAATNVNLWRDLLPHRLKDALSGKTVGEKVSLDFSAEEIIQPSAANALRTVRPAQFDGARMSLRPVKPRFGRFYPKGVLKGVTNIFKGNRQPFRLVDVDDNRLTVDLGHPLSGRSIELSATVESVKPKTMERGGTVQDWGEIITQGVGMQARWNRTPSDFFVDAPFAREDEQPDRYFYEHPRLVQHLDSRASGMVGRIYSRFISDGANVLDLMSSWQSHLPANNRMSGITGLGLNPTELAQNKQLTDFIVSDLNSDTSLPFEPDIFDVVVCTASVEYLKKPISVFQEVARVLRPGGWFVVTFSNRWFETKTIGIWPRLHEFERMGLVTEYFRQSERFTGLGTHSIRGLERPVEDKYHGRIPYSDPIYAVWGQSRR